jgi:glycosyltransferase involved in cell wall biosynthesis
LITETNPGDIWYFFWARGWSDMLPFISIPQGIKKYVRFHNYDLYLERNGGYIPFRKSFFDLIDVLLPISESGRLYLENVFLIDPEKIAVVRLGTISKGRSYFSRDGIFRLVSCSNMVSVKRIDKIIGALKLIKDERIAWLHIGDGALKDELQNLARALGPNIQVSFIGKLAPFEVLEYYIGHPVDLFINTSEFEGVPVSIMEAFSAGIPVIATDVGGTSEIVDNTVGVLLEPTADSFTISREVKKFIRLTGQERQDLSNAAFERYQNLCNANVCAEKLITILCKNDSDC